MTALSTTASSSSAARVPLWLKLLYSAFMLVLVPVYWRNYGPTNFLYFCDVALLITLAALWLENALLASIAAAGIVVPQLFWCADFACELSGHKLSGLTSYMFDTARPGHLRGLSLFHAWLPWLLLWLVRQLGYDRRGLAWWSVTGWALCLVAYLWLPEPGATGLAPGTPTNVNYVFGMDEQQPQERLAPWAYLLAWMASLWLLVWLPAHVLLNRLWGAEDESEEAEERRPATL